LTLRFRPAEPHDAGLAVPLIYSAGPEGFEYVFTQGRRNAREFLAYAFTDGVGLFGCGNHRVAEYEGRVVGIGAFYSGSEYTRLSQDLLRQILRFYRFAGLPVLRRAMQTTRWMPPPGRRTLYIANLGVAPDCRSRGIGARLLHEQMQRARSAGLAKLALDVAATNPAAQRLYERLGLRVVRESAAGLSRNGITLPAVRRMELLL
jgi:ribosomal protein S18 acetylase RimI-like enzyme